jgi:hypothetical protein
VVALEAGEMIWPVFTWPPPNLRVGKHQLDIAEIPRKGRTGQAAHIFYENRHRFDCPNDVYGLREHIPFISVTAMLAPDRERLAGHPRSKKLDSFRHLAIVKRLNTALIDWPTCHVGNIPPLIFM